MGRDQGYYHPALLGTDSHETCPARAVLQILSLLRSPESLQGPDKESELYPNYIGKLLKSGKLSKMIFKRSLWLPSEK